MELLEALKTIRDECSTHDQCKCCPLRSKTNESSCSLDIREHAPADWELIGDDATIPKLFV